MSEASPFRIISIFNNPLFRFFNRLSDLLASSSIFPLRKMAHLENKRICSLTSHSLHEPRQRQLIHVHQTLIAINPVHVLATLISAHYLLDYRKFADAPATCTSATRSQHGPLHDPPSRSSPRLPPFVQELTFSIIDSSTDTPSTQAAQVLLRNYSPGQLH